MKMRQTCAYMMIVGGVMLFSGGPSWAEQSTSGTPSGGAMRSGSGTGSENAGSPSGTIRPDQRHGIDGRSDVPKTGGDPTMGGSGRMADPGTNTQRKGSSGGSGSGSGFGSGSGSGGMGSSGGTGASSGGGGY
jgi:hypothetical protein